MEDGIKILQLVGRYNNWAITFVGWMRRVGSGDEWHLLPGARVILKRNGHTGIGLTGLAGQGLTSSYWIKEPSATHEHVHRLLVRRCIAADEKAWAKDCPRPKGWYTP